MVFCNSIIFGVFVIIIMGMIVLIVNLICDKIVEEKSYVLECSLLEVMFVVFVDNELLESSIDVEVVMLLGICNMEKVYIVK